MPYHVAFPGSPYSCTDTNLGVTRHLTRYLPGHGLDDGWSGSCGVILERHATMIDITLRVMEPDRFGAHYGAVSRCPNPSGLYGIEV